MDDPLSVALRARGLKLGVLPEKGRCLFSAKRFSRGEVVIDQAPYVAVVDAELDRRCGFCFKEDSSKQCPSCKSVYYCSINCQKQEQDVHKHECESLINVKSRRGRELTPSLRLMLRLLIKRHLQKDKSAFSDAMNNYDVVETLPTHFTDIPEYQLTLYAQMANLLKSIYRFEDAEIKDITENFCRLACNAHKICDEELRPLGTALYPALSFINHSCRPNCILMFEGRNAVVRAVETIKEGEEVTMSYVELGEVTRERQRKLQEQYYFYCNCPRCAQENSIKEDAFLESFMCLNCKELLMSDPGGSDKLYCKSCAILYDKSMLQKHVDESNALLNEALRLVSDQRMDYVEAKCKLQHLDQLQAKVFQQDSLHRIKTYDNLMKVCMSLEDWPAALHYCSQAIPAYKKVYMKYHPLIGLQLYTCGKLKWYLGKTLDAIKAYKQALGILEITHGLHSPLVRNLKCSLQEAEAEAFFLQQQR